MQIESLLTYTAQLLNIRQYRDYAPNGLQIAGRDRVSRVLCGVSANRPLIDYAILQGFDTILVHHGFFWKNEDPCIVGWKKARLTQLLAHQINLFAYHLPLDAHPDVGNNAQLALKLGLTTESTGGDQQLLHIGRCEPQSLQTLAKHIHHQLARAPLVIGDLSWPIQRVGWCTGGAQQLFNEAIQAGVDAYITGEISEQMVDIALESQVAFIAAGHYATERYGVQALAAHWQARFGMEWEFLDTGNPV